MPNSWILISVALSGIQFIKGWMFKIWNMVKICFRCLNLTYILFLLILFCETQIKLCSSDIVLVKSMFNCSVTLAKKNLHRSMLNMIKVQTSLPSGFLWTSNIWTIGLNAWGGIFQSLHYTTLTIVSGVKGWFHVITMENQWTNVSARAKWWSLTPVSQLLCCPMLTSDWSAWPALTNIRKSGLSWLQHPWCHPGGDTSSNRKLFMTHALES